MIQLPANFKPMKCPSNFTLKPEDLVKLKFPVFTSPKLDGIRMTTTGSSYLQTASGHCIPNRYISTVLSDLPAGLDGELGVGNPTDPLFYHKTQSAIMTREGVPEFTFYIFDIVPECFKNDGLNWTVPFSTRLVHWQEIFPRVNPAFINDVKHNQCNTPEEVMSDFEHWVRLGYEGICIRSATGLYKYGRSTFREGFLLRLKQEAQSEARILRVNQMEINNNDLERTPLGYAKRASYQENQIPYASVGSFDVIDIHTKVEFTVGIFKGITAEERERWWKERDTLPGRILTYRFHDYGIKDAPRSPRFIGWRTAEDMS